MASKRVVVVTGGGSGMGRAIARRFASNGDTVYILGRRSNKLEETAKGFDSIIPVVCDVTDLEAIEKSQKIIAKSHKTIDVLINNAGGSYKVSDSASSNEKLEAWDQIIKTNLTSVFAMIMVFEKSLARPGGRIINITSMAALGGSRQGGVSGQAYSAAKSGIHGINRTLARSLGEEGITINALAPGVIDNTEFFPASTVPGDLKGRYIPITPMGRLGDSEEIADGVFYLASDQAGFITGEILNINGGVQFGR